MRLDDDESDDDFELIGQIAEHYVEILREGGRPTSEQLHRDFPGFQGDVGGLMKTLAVLEEASFRRVSNNRAPSVVSASGARLRTLGSFRLIREINRGGMGVVYEAEQESLHRRVAIKVLPPSPMQTNNERLRFEREGIAIARLHHSNIVPLFGTGEQDGVQYCVMQYISGCALDDLIAELRCRFDMNVSDHDVNESSQRSDSQVIERGIELLMSGNIERHQAPVDEGSQIEFPSSDLNQRLDRSQSLGKRYWLNLAQLGADIANALEHAHHQGVLHRDVKPGNLILDSSGHIWVADFGLAKLQDNENLTDTGNFVGTLRYTAPEQFQGQVDNRTDIYGLGLTLYELCTLEPAFTSSERPELMRKVIQESPPNPRTLNPKIPRDLETIILKAIASNPTNRYQTAGVFAADLRRFLADRPVQARRITAIERGWRWCRRNRIESMFAGLALILLLLLTGTGIVAYLRETRLRIESQRTAKRTIEALDRVYDAYLPNWTTSSTVSAHGSISVSPAAAELLEGLIGFYDEVARNQISDSDKSMVLEGITALRRVGLIYHRLGQFEKARLAYLASTQRLREIHELYPDRDVKIEYAKVLNEQGAVYWTQHDFEMAYECHKQALSLLEAMSSDDTNEPLDHNLQFETARSLYLIGRRHMGLEGGVIHRSRFELLFGSASINIADQTLAITRAVRLLEALTDRDPANFDYQLLLALSYREQSDGFLDATGNPEDVSVVLAIEKLEDLVEQAPHRMDYRYSLCQTLQWLNLNSDPTPQAVAEAENRFERSIAIARALQDQRPDEWIYSAARIHALVQLSTVYRKAEAQPSAVATLNMAIEQAESLLENYPDENWFQYLVAAAYRRKGGLLKLANPDEAMQAYQKSISMLENLVNPDLAWNGIVHRSLSKCYRHSSKLLTAEGRTDEARESSRRSTHNENLWLKSLPQTNPSPTQNEPVAETADSA